MAQEYEAIVPSSCNGTEGQQMDESADINSVWDELSHQQSREIQQHQSRISCIESSISTNNDYDYGVSTPPHRYIDGSRMGIRKAMQQTAAVLSSAATAAAEVAKDGVANVAASATAVCDGFTNNPGRGLPIKMKNGRGRGIGGSGSVDYEYIGPYSNPRHHSQYRPLEDSLTPLAEFGLLSTPSASIPEGDVTSRDTFHEGPRTSLLENDYNNGNGDNLIRTNKNIPGSSNNENNFIILNSFRLRPRREGWGMVANLDLFFTSLYNYYYHRGLLPIIGKGFVELITLFFTVWLSVFLINYIDWPALVKCTDETTCKTDLQSYIIERPFRHASVWNFVTISYIVLFSAYGILEIVTFLKTVRDALESKHIFEDKLGISAQKLEGGAVEWHEVVEKLLKFQRDQSYRIAQNGEDIKDELAVTQRILRRENFMIAFFNRNMLDLTLPFGFSFQKVFYSKSLEWSIYFCVLSYMFNHKYQIRPAFYTDPVALKRRFVICGIVQTVCTPFQLLFMTLHFLMQNVYDFRSSEQYLGPRDWSNVAKWTFREFNELPHVFERRLGPSYVAAEEYLRLFGPSSLISSIGRVLVFLAGSVGGCLILLGFVNDAILLHVKLGNWNLLWYVGVLGVLFSVGKMMLPDHTNIPRYHHNLFADMNSALEKVASHTHHYPEFWKKRGWDNLIKGAFSELYQFKVKLFVMEIVSVIVAPFVLCFSLPNCANEICSFVQKIKVEVSGAGDHCAYSTFDFDLCEDESWEGQKMGIDIHSTHEAGGSMNHTRCTSDAKKQSSLRPKARRGKMEKSFFNFKAVHPNWKCSSSGQDLIDRMEKYKNQQAIALTLERQHHIEAAERQLETLQRIEDKAKAKLDSLAKNNEHIDENYMIHKVEEPGVDEESGKPLQTIQSHVTQEDSFSRPANISRQTSPLNANQIASTPPENISSSKYQRDGTTTSSVLHYADVDLSTELQRVLTLDPEASFSAGLIGPDVLSLSQINPSIVIDSDRSKCNDVTREQNVQRQYLWLERYHSHLKSNDN